MILCEPLLGPAPDLLTRPATAYQHALNATGVRDPQRVLFVDDRADNCHTARRLGLRTLHYISRPADLTATLQSPN
ncbi:HAD-IA family hydrolase [Streptomyces rubrogriseus]|uniref:HAD-IA family hydrolase n=1 Tax=Streptomyces rubrogriseus TaxID=194673 RepID=UPI00378BC987